MSELSRTQIDKLGERLKKDELSEEDLRLLDQFRQSFTPSYQEVVGKITNELGLAPTGRLAKSTASISEKLRRESIRLNQIQDIAGCRIIVHDIEAQDRAVEAISTLFEKVSIVDRRAKPSYGYRAAHVVVKSTSTVVEVQIRTKLQHTWAELSEKLADRLGQGLKYGIGKSVSLELLIKTSEMVEKHEELERGVLKIRPVLTELTTEDNLDSDIREKVRAVQNQLVEIENEREALRHQILKTLQAAIDRLSKRRD